MKKSYVATIVSLIAGQAFAATSTTWITPTGSSNSNANLPAGTTYTSNFGIAFTTGSDGPFNMDWLTLGLSTSTVTAGTASLKVALRNTNNTTAYSAVAGTTEYAMDTVTFSMPTTTATNFNLELDAAEFPNISGYVMAANTTYALIVYNPTQNIGLQRHTGYANGTTNDFYTVTEGFTVIDTFRSNSANYSNNSSSFPTLAFSFGEMSAIPEPGSLVSLSVLVSSAAFLRTRRKASAASISGC
jgi:hypothetical protein